MSDDIASKLFETLQNHVELRFVKKAPSFVQPGGWKDAYDSWLRDASHQWDLTLNKIGVKRIELHLNPRESRERVVRIRDPFVVAFKRLTEISESTADKILLLGLPD